MGRFLKVETLTNEDIENIKIRKECFDIVEEATREFEQKMLDNVLYNSNIDIELLDESYIKYYNLSKLYRRTEKSLLILILSLTGIILSILGILYQNEKVSIIYLIGIISIIGLIFSIRNYLIRKKLINNFKSLSIKYK